MRIFYPYYDLQKTIHYMEQSRNNILATTKRKKLTRLEILPMLGFSTTSGAGQTVIASLAQYGFLEKESGKNGKYYFTDLARRIIDPQTTASDRSSVLNQAIANPPLFKDLRDLGGHPADWQIEAVMNRYDISGEKAKKAYRVYIDSAKIEARSAYARRKINRINEKQVESIVSSVEYIKIPLGNGKTIDLPKSIILETASAWHDQELKKIQQM